MRCHRPLGRQYGREQPALPRLDRADDPEHTRSDPTQHLTRNQSVALVVAETTGSKLIQRHEAVLGRKD